LQLRFLEGELGSDLLEPFGRNLVCGLVQILFDCCHRLSVPAERDVCLADVVEHGEVRPALVGRNELLQASLVVARVGVLNPLLVVLPSARTGKLVRWLSNLARS